MVIQVYNSRVRAIRDFVPARAGKVSMYVCGATVQSAPHIGHLGCIGTHPVADPLA